MDNKSDLYEPVVDFRKNRSQIQINPADHHELYEKAFFPAEETSHSEYALNTTSWD